ncbi:Sucrose synthase [Datura stramonium]|uniref:Sucrose synthase n=1 Tax=Datura stramonium TaxID=4076 RepID=A0ABS8VE93_DATST|nr:Sucrose synthase [Datura stramonium]
MPDLTKQLQMKELWLKDVKVLLYNPPPTSTYYILGTSLCLNWVFFIFSIISSWVGFIYTLGHSGSWNLGFPIIASKCGGSTALKRRAKALGEAASADESDDALQLTIEKSKKVLAMQQDLLQQGMKPSASIAERRKVVSSIKSSLADAQDFFDGGNGSLSDVDIILRWIKTIMLLPSAAAATITDVPKYTAAISQDFVESKREVKKDLAQEGMLKNSTQKAAQSDERASPLSRSSITASSQTSSNISSAKRALNVPQTPMSSQQTPLDEFTQKFVRAPGKEDHLQLH